MTITEAEILKAIDEALFLPFTNSPIKKPVETAANRIFITVQNPAVPIVPTDYQNGWSPGKSGDNAIVTKRFSDWVDAVPALEPTHRLNGQKISQLYAQLLGATFKASGLETEPRSYQEAESILYQTVTVHDNKTGQSTPQTVDSDLYRRYKEAKAAYSNALAVYQSQYISHTKTPEGKAMWSLLSAGFHAPVEVAWNQYRAAEASRVEDALGTLDRMSNNLVSNVFREANQQYSGYQKPDPVNPSRSFSPSYPMPSNWVDAIAGWTELEFSFKHQTSVYQNLPLIDGVLDAETTSLTIRFQFKVVRIERPWLRFDLFNLPNWSVDSVAPGTYSNGTKSQLGQSLWPLIPQAFIAVRGLEASGIWSDADIARIQTAIAGSEPAEFARFLLNGSYLSNGKSIAYRATFDDEVLTFPGVHIVGWINRILPFLPPKSDIKSV